jgi:hypothetical protein
LSSGLELSAASGALLPPLSHANTTYCTAKLFE